MFSHCKLLKEENEVLKRMIKQVWLYISHISYYIISINTNSIRIIIINRNLIPIIEYISYIKNQKSQIHIVTYKLQFLNSVFIYITIVIAE